MKNLMKNFHELSYFELLETNGGYGGSSGGGRSGSKGGSSRGYSGSSSGSSKSSKKSGGKSGYNALTSGLSAPRYVAARERGRMTKEGRTAYYTPSSGVPTSPSAYSGSSSGSGGAGKGGDPYAKNNEYESKLKEQYQNCDNVNDVHCDIIAWNHAVDAGLNPAGDGVENWNGNKLTVNDIFNNYYKDKATDFNSDLAGKKGYIFYDWNGQGKYEHVEYCEINENGSGYWYYKNNGYEKGEEYVSTTFANDSNASAKDDGNGKLKFVALN